jgi:hypothetical protein
VAIRNKSLGLGDSQIYATYKLVAAEVPNMHGEPRHSIRHHNELAVAVGWSMSIMIHITVTCAEYVIRYLSDSQLQLFDLTRS